MLRRCAPWLFIALLLAFPTSAEPAADRFAVAGITAAQARSMLEALQNGLRTDDRARIAELVEYPLRVNSSGTHKVISGRSEFLSNFSSVFTSEIRQQVLAQQFDQLFVNWQGVMLGNGAIWFSGVCDSDSPAGTCRNLRVRIIAINLDGPR